MNDNKIRKLCQIRCSTPVGNDDALCTNRAVYMRNGQHGIEFCCQSHYEGVGWAYIPIYVRTALARAEHEASK